MPFFSILYIHRRTGTLYVKVTNVTKSISKRAKRNSWLNSGKQNKFRPIETRPTLKFYVTRKYFSKVWHLVLL